MSLPTEIKLHGPEAFAGMRSAGRVAAACLDMLAPHVVPGATTGQLDDFAREFVLSHGALPALFGYRGYRHTICTSVNQVVCDGLPSAYRLKRGDIASIHIAVIVDGWHAATTRMYSAGEVKRKAAGLMDVAYEAMMRGIDTIKPGAELGDIGVAIQGQAERQRYSVVDVFCGHGIGRVLHELPNVLHFRTKGDGIVLKAGMIFTVQPMINLGRKDVRLPDGRTAVTRDRSLSAEYGHSVGVAETGCEIFTLSPGGLHTPHAAGARC